MPATDEQLNAARRQLGVLVSRVHAYVSHSAQLLAPTAKRSPGSAEATAHALSVKARLELEAWLRRSEELLGLPPPASEPQLANQESQ